VNLSTPLHVPITFKANVICTFLERSYNVRWLTIERTVNVRRTLDLRC